jgi:RNA polymerase sigma factor (sigma-70 family)
MELRHATLIATNDPATDPPMDRTELERSLEELHGQTWGWALACCGRDEGLAEEALQSAYLRILSGRAQFDNRSAFRTWVFGVVRRTALEETRRERVTRARESGDSEATQRAVDPAPGADITAEHVELHEMFITALKTLSRRQRQVLDLVFYHDMTIEEAAGVMEVSVGSARTHYTRGKKALGTVLDRARDGVAAPMRKAAR